MTLQIQSPTVPWGFRLLLARILNLSPSMVSRMLSGERKVSVRSARKLSRLYGQPETFWRDIHPDALISELCTRTQVLD